MIAVGFLGLLWLLCRFVPKLRPFTGQLLTLAAVLWVGVVFFVISFSFPVRFQTGNTTSATIPRVWFYALVPAFILAVYSVIRGREPDPKWGNIMRVAIILGGLVLSVTVFYMIGYYVSSALFLVLVMWVLGSRKKLELILVPAGWVVFSYVIFAWLLHVRLPVGFVFSGLFN
jgi:hypothetical protein